MADLTVWQSILLGIVQGITEFLPISSSAHLRIIPEFFGWGDPGAAFTAVTQLGTIAAVLLYFRRDLWNIGSTWLRSLWTPELRSEQDAKLAWYIGLGTIPIGIVGFLFEEDIETTARNLYLIAAALILLGLVLLAAEKVGTRTRQVEDITLRDGLLMGLAQTAALIPGVSRAGSTITAGLFLGLDRPAAARFSFLLSIPAVVASGLFTLPDAVGGQGPGVVPTAIATVLAFVSGYASIAFLLRFLATNSTMVFVVYRVVLGALVLVLLAAGVISAT